MIQGPHAGPLQLGAQPSCDPKSQRESVEVECMSIRLRGKVSGVLSASK